MRTPKKVYLIALSLLVLPAPFAIGQQSPASAPPSAQPVVAQEAPLTNADVAKLCKLDLGDEVVIAKINQAKAVEFKLDTDGLVALKQEGVSKGAITAMLNRVSAPPARNAPAVDAPRAAGGFPGAVPMGLPDGSEEGVLLRTAQGERRLQSVQGDISSTWIYVATLMFLDFPGLKADVNITERRPVVIVRSSKSPRGRVFLVKCASNTKDNDRSVKVGRAKLFSQKSWSTPDKDWVVDVDVKELPDNTWEMTPREDMKPGEYGVLFRGGFYGTIVGTGAELFDFGVGNATSETGKPVAAVPKP